MAVDVATSPALATAAYTAVATASFDAAAGTILVAAAAGLDVDTISNSGAALTWTMRVQRSNGNFDVRMWTAPVPSARTGMSVTVNGTALIGGLKVWVVTGQDGTTPVGQTGNGVSTSNNATPTAYNATRAGSLGFAVGYEADINAGTSGSPTSTDIEEAFSMDALYDIEGAGIMLRKAATASAASEAVTINLDAGGTGTADWIWAAVEIVPPDSLDAEVDLSVIAVPTTLPAVSVSAGSSATPTPVAVPAALPAPSVSAGSSVVPAPVAVAVALPAPSVTTENTEIVNLTTIPVPASVPAPSVSSGSQVEAATIAAAVAVHAPTVEVHASVALAPITVPVQFPGVVVTVPILPGDNMDGDPGQIEFNGTLLGRTTSYRWRTLAGWRDRPGIDSGNAPRPTRHGSWAGRPLLQERTITWTALLRAPRDEVEAAVQALEQALPVLDDETELPLVINDLGTPYLIYAGAPRLGLPVDQKLRLGHGQLTLQWVCSDPRRYNINSTGVTIPVDDEATVANAGNIATHPILRVHGPVDTPAVLNNTLNRLVAFDVELLAGEQLVINCDLGTATVGGVDVMGQLTGASVHPSDWVLARGSNVVSHSADVDGVEVDVLYRDAWA